MDMSQKTRTTYHLVTRIIPVKDGTRERVRAEATNNISSLLFFKHLSRPHTRHLTSSPVALKNQKNGLKNAWNEVLKQLNIYPTQDLDNH